MQIILNDREEYIESNTPITVRQLLDIRKMTFRMFLVRINENIIKKEDYNTALIQNGDNVKVHYIMSGG